MKDIEKKIQEIRNNSFVAKAMVEDYARVVGKLEGVSPKVVLERLLKRANELMDEFKTEE